MTTEVASKSRPSDFARDPKFRDPRTPPFRDENGVYHVFSYADVMRVLMNREQAFSRDPTPWLPAGPHHMALDFMWAVEPFTVGGEEGRHDVLRSVVEPWFRTRAVRTMEPVIRELTAQLIDEIVAKGTGELNLARELAYPLSMRVICRLTGIELEREQWLREKLDEFARAASYESLPTQWDVQAYFRQMIAKRLARPMDELLDVLIAAWREGRIDDAEVLGYIYGFVTAGSDTTGTSFANAFTLLAEFGQLEYARSVLDDEEALRRIVEEVLRFGTPFPTKPLFVVKNTQFGRLTVPAGQRPPNLVRRCEPRRSCRRRSDAERSERFRPTPVAEPARCARLGEALLSGRRPLTARDADPPPRSSPAAARARDGRREAVRPLRRHRRRCERSLVHVRPG
jgi:cytochrome P450